MVAQAKRAGQQPPGAEASLSHQPGGVVQPADAQSGVNVGGIVARAQAGDHMVGRQVGEGEVDQAIGELLSRPIRDER